jgi:hypothetical protein
VIKFYLGDKRMPQKIKKYTEDFLKTINAVDTTERLIKTTDYVNFYCHSCNVVGNIKLNNALNSFKKKGYSYCCLQCKRRKMSEFAKKRKGKLNPFYGKKHSKETIKQISETKKKQIQALPKDYVMQHAEMMRKAAYKKYGMNPMLVPSIKDKHYEATHTEEFISRAKTQGLLLKNTQDFTQKMSHFSKVFWKSEEGSKRKQIYREFCINEFNNPAGKFYHKRIDSLKIALKLMFEDGVKRFFLREWVEKNIDNLPKKNSSEGEKELLAWIKEIGFINAKKIRMLDPITNKKIELDIFIPELNIGFEYNGDYYHSEVYLDNHYHLAKTLFFKNKGIRVIHIFENTWKKRKPQFKSYIMSATKINKNKVGARKCELKEVSVQDAILFLDSYHIQGHTKKIKKAFGLYKDGELLALATFGAHHRNNKKIVLNRFVSKTDWTISGALSRLSKAASNYFKQDIITWADNSISEGNGYISSGWELEEILKPDYFYTNGRKSFSKQSRRKSLVGTPNNLTEHQHALLDGLFRVYDCGKTRFIYKYKPE